MSATMTSYDIIWSKKRWPRARWVFLVGPVGVSTDLTILDPSLSGHDPRGVATEPRGDGGHQRRPGHSPNSMGDEWEKS